MNLRYEEPKKYSKIDIQKIKNSGTEQVIKDKYDLSEPQALTDRQ